MAFSCWFNPMQRSSGVSLKLLSFGKYPETSLDEARAKRGDAKKLLDDGIDPSVEKKSRRRAEQMALRNTFKAVADELMGKFKAEGNAPATLKKKEWLLDFANREFRKRPIAVGSQKETSEGCGICGGIGRRMRG
jgi:hypothetical protein